MITYNYVCINDECTIRGNVPVRKEEVDENRVEFCHICERPMKQIGYIPNVAIKGDIQTRMLRNQQYFKQRAKRHAQSDEQQHLKKKRTDQEMKSLTNKK